MDGFQPQPDDYPHDAGHHESGDGAAAGHEFRDSDESPDSDEFPDSHELGDVPGGSDTPAEDPIDHTELPEPPQTGDQAVDEATGNVARAMHEPLEAQLAAYELAHRTLQDRLADVES